MVGRNHWLICLAILFLALSHGGLYASSLPPWGLIDEQQHFHYVQHVAREQALPVAGDTYLSPEIIDSLFVTRRWETFHWPTPASQDPEELGLEGHSYQSYQPPLFYTLLAPLYAVLPGGMVAKLYSLRWIMVGLSLLTVWMAYRIAAEVFPQGKALPYLACFMLVMIPERTAAVSRVNNDVLLEVLATAFVWVLTRAMLRGLSVRRSQVLGLLLGLGVLTKTSMGVLAFSLPLVFWTNRRDSGLIASALWIGGITTSMLLPFVVRNMQLYGDFTGFAGFRQLNNAFGVFQAADVTWSSSLAAVWDLFRHFWVIWWKGASVGSNPVITISHIALALLSILSLATVLSNLRRSWKCRSWGKREAVVATYSVVILSYALAILISYFNGQVPVIQGRFLLPVIVPTVVLFCWGLQSCLGRKTLMPVALGVLSLIGVLSLFGNLLLYFYYWSAFTATAGPQSCTFLGERAAWNLFLTRFLSDKPPGVQMVLPWIMLLYLASLVSAAVLLVKTNLFCSDPCKPLCSKQ